MPSRKVVLSFVSTLALLLASTSLAVARPREDQPTPIARGARISGVVQSMAHRPSSAAPAAGTATNCGPGGGNLKTDCASTGRPVNETSIATNGSLIVAGANDYNSYNGQGQDGYYWPTDGTTWNDAGPIDVFPHNNNNGSGDPGLAVDTNGVVYYSSLFFNFYRCNVGGVELLRRDPATGSWSYYEIASNSNAQFQDKPAIALGGSKVFVSWTQFGSCSGANVISPIRVAVLSKGVTSSAPTDMLTVPGSTYSQGSSIQVDGSGGFWIAWEEWLSATATNGEIRIAHWTPSGWAQVSGSQQWEKISPTSFTDLPSPLPGFSFRDNSFPALAMVSGRPWVTWTSYDTGAGRAYLWNGSGAATAIAGSTTNGDQFFPAIAPDGNGGAYVSYSQVNAGTSTYDQWLWNGSAATQVSKQSSDPSQDAFFSGQFIGDYNGMTVVSGAAVPIWTDIRGSDPNYPGWEMDSMTVPATTSGGGGGGSTATVPGAPTNLSATPGDGQVSLTWTAPSDDGGSAITNYEIYRGTTSGSESLLTTIGNQLDYTDAAVSNGTTYYYKVAAVNVVGPGPLSNAASATPTASSTATVPSAPQNLSAAPAKGKGIQLTWEVPSSDGGSAITGYNVYRSTDGGQTYALYATPGNVTSYKDTHTTRGATYWYYVTAVNGVGEGPESNPGSATAT